MTRSPRQTIVLLGANGRTGRAFLHRALEHGHHVTAVVRSPDRLADLEHPSLTVRVGSATDAAFLQATMIDCSAVISTLGPRWPTRSAAAIYPESAEAIVEAMRNTGVTRLLVTSSALLFPANDVQTRLLRWLVAPIVSASGSMEARITASPLEWTLVRTSYLNDKPDEHCRVGVDALPQGGSAVSRAAVAAFLLDTLEEERHIHQTVGLCG